MFKRYFYAANAVDAALNGAIMYLEALLLLVIISIYGIDTVLLDIRFMFKEHPRGILVYMKYSWVISFILIASAITMKCVFLSRGYIGEILIIVLIFLPLFLFAVYNTFRYLLRGVNQTGKLAYAKFYFKNFRKAIFCSNQFLQKDQRTNHSVR